MVYVLYVKHRIGVVSLFKHHFTTPSPLGVRQGQLWGVYPLEYHITRDPTLWGNVENFRNVHKTKLQIQHKSFPYEMFICKQ